MNAANWKQVAGQRIRRLSPEQAKAILARISADGVTAFHPAIRELTGGYSSQSISFDVIRKLGVKAGIIKCGQ